MRLSLFQRTILQVSCELLFLFIENYLLWFDQAFDQKWPIVISCVSMSSSKPKFNDLGLETKSHADGYRALNKDGSFNVSKQNNSFFEGVNIYHSLVSMRWLHFFGLIILIYFCINLIFASLWIFGNWIDRKGCRIYCDDQGLWWIFFPNGLFQLFL